MNRIVPVVLAVALFMENMDSTVIATSLPTIAADIGTSPIALKLALTSYYVALAIFIPISGRLADRYGPKMVFRLAIATFVAGSLACGAASSLEGFVAARFLQGMGGAMMTPVGRLLLVRAVPKSDLVSAMAWFSIPAMIGPLVGPPVGGAITTFWHWRYIFLINLPIGIIGIALATKYLPHVDGVPDVHFDWKGFVLSGLACAGIVFGLSVVSLPALPPILGLFLAGAGALAALVYIRHARRTERPVLDLSLLKVRTFRAALSGGILFRIGTGALPFLLPLMLQLGFGYSPFQSGMITIASIGGAMVMKFLVRPALRRFGFKGTLIGTSLVGGLLTACVGLFTQDMPLAVLIVLLLSGGFFRSLFFTGINTLGFADIPHTRAGDGTAMLAAVQQVSIATGVAVAGGILELFLVTTGRTSPMPGDFTVAFAIVGLISAAAAIPFLRLPSEAGAEISGRRAQPAE
ncbi:MFS transporter [Mangrovicella endophytica]|uniref:MFS transporter n=1 Tax=Mangrovicella endophytica TaxID=2066697 RepID=UPI000C9DE97B|nr:MFS transporter [Mangrovicella endophytica]